MTEEDLIEELAQIGLRVIFRVYRHHPKKAYLLVEEALGITDLKQTDSAKFDFEMNSDRASRVIPLINRMIDDGYINGKTINNGLSDATLPAAMRTALRRKNEKGILLIEEIRLALLNIAQQNVVEPGQFTALAARIGFEP